MDIIMSGQVGYETALRLYKENKKFLDERFPGFYIEQFLNIEKEARNMDMSQEGISLEEGGLFAAIWKLCEEKNYGCEIDIKKVPIRQEVIEICELFDVNPYEARSAEAMVFVADGDAADRNVVDGDGSDKSVSDGDVADRKKANGNAVDGSVINRDVTGRNVPGGKVAGEDIEDREMTDCVDFTVIGKATKSEARVVLMGTDAKTGKRKKRFLTPPERQKKDLANASRK